MNKFFQYSWPLIRDLVGLDSLPLERPGVIDSLGLSDHIYIYKIHFSFLFVPFTFQGDSKILLNFSLKSSNITPLPKFHFSYE